MSEEQLAPDNVPPDNKGSTVLKDYCKDAEVKQLERYRKRRKAAPLAPRYTIKVKDYVPSFKMNQEPENIVALMEACGTADGLFAQVHPHSMREAKRMRSLS